jgi:hypothetical protein
MNQSITSRLALPALVSIAGITLTQAWYVKTGSGFSKPSAIGKPLAILSAKNERIERRPTTRLIWESLSTGENLYGGEAVRTNSNSSGKITFLQSGMTIGLEPDSLVIIEESNGNLQLNLVNGGVFVKNTTTPAGTKTQQPVLKAGDKKIELAGKSSELNLSVGASGTADIQVTKGDAKIGTAGGKTEVLKEGAAKSISANGATQSLEITGPRSGSSIPLSGLNDRVNIAWGKAPDGATMFLETGSSRDSLTRSGAGVPASAGQLSLPVKSGDFFWRVVAVKDGKVISTGPTTFNQGVAFESPKLLSNAANEKIIAQKPSGPYSIKLAWTRPQGAEGMTVSISKDPQFKSTVDSKSFTTETEWSATVSEPGKYYWRTAASWPGIERKIFSTPGAFEVTQQKTIPAPVISGPAGGSVISSLAAGTNGVILTWNSIAGVESYDLEIQKRQSDNSYKTQLAKNITGTQFRVTNVAAGDYQWFVKSRVGDSVSQAGAPSKFAVKELPAITPATKVSKDAPLVFESSDSLISLPLAALPASTAQIRYKLRSALDSSFESPWQISPGNAPLRFKLPTAGQYLMTAEALDAKQQIIATSQNIELTAKAPDLLPPPQLVTNVTKLKTGNGGDISLNWKPVPGAVRYIVEITGTKTNFRKEIPGTKINMSNMLPGNHTLVLTAVDKAGRSGTKSAGINIEVPDVSSIAAPTSKGIRIK